MADEPHDARKPPPLPASARLRALGKKPLRPRGGFNVTVRDPAVRRKLLRRRLATLGLVALLSLLYVASCWFQTGSRAPRGTTQVQEMEDEVARSIGGRRLELTRGQPPAVLLVALGSTTWRALDDSPKSEAASVAHEVALAARAAGQTLLFVLRAPDLTPDQNRRADLLLSAIRTDGINLIGDAPPPRTSDR
jgi:hypothetical protein